jgi:hypothetical protein
MNDEEKVNISKQDKIDMPRQIDTADNKTANQQPVQIEQKTCTCV